MKLFFVGILLTLWNISAFATGCGGSEFYLKNTVPVLSYNLKQIEGNPIVEAIRDVYGNPSFRISVDLPFFNGNEHVKDRLHKLHPAATAPATLTTEQLEKLVNDPATKIEVVADSFEVECTNYYIDEAAHLNLRITLNYEGQPIEFRTDYMPSFRW